MTCSPLSMRTRMGLGMNTVRNVGRMLSAVSKSNSTTCNQRSMLVC